jgi:hypothetical protein
MIWKVKRKFYVTESEWQLHIFYKVTINTWYCTQCVFGIKTTYVFNNTWNESCYEFWHDQWLLSNSKTMVSLTNGENVSISRLAALSVPWLRLNGISQSRLMIMQRLDCLIMVAIHWRLSCWHSTYLKWGCSVYYSYTAIEVLPIYIWTRKSKQCNLRLALISGPEASIGLAIEIISRLSPQCLGRTLTQKTAIISTFNKSPTSNLKMVTCLLRQAHKQRVLCLAIILVRCSRSRSVFSSRFPKQLQVVSRAHCCMMGCTGVATSIRRIALVTI